MNINKKLLTYVFVSIAVHGLVFWLIIEFAPRFKPAKPQQQKPIIKSYLLVTKPKPETQPEPEQLQVQQTSEPVIEERATQELSAREETESVSSTETNLTESVDSSEQQAKQSKQEAIMQEQVVQTVEQVKNSKTRAPSPYAAAQNYLNSLEQDKITGLSQQSITELRQAKPLTNSFGRKSAEQYNQARSDSFAAKGSGIKVVAELSHGTTLVRLGKSCMMVKMEKGEQVWMGSNACGAYDPFKGQLKKSLNKYLNKGKLDSPY